MSMTQDNKSTCCVAGELEQLVSQVEILRSIECPICTEIPLPPIYQCQNGHSVCSNCKEKLANCGLCHGKLTETRNYAIESIVNASKFKCRYSADGCGEILKGEHQKAHVKVCEYRPIKCYEHGVVKCHGASVPFREFFEHLRSVHKIAGETGKESTTHFPITCSAPDLNHDRRFPSFYMVFDKNQFLSNVSLKNGIMTWWVTLLGQEEEAEGYLAKMVLYDSDNDKMQVEFTFPVHSVRKPVEEIRKSALCAMLPVESMLPYMKERLVGDTRKQVWSTKYKFVKLDD